MIMVVTVHKTEFGVTKRALRDSGGLEGPVYAGWGQKGISWDYGCTVVQGFGGLHSPEPDPKLLRLKLCKSPCKSDQTSGSPLTPKTLYACNSFYNNIYIISHLSLSLVLFCSF